MNDKQTKKLQDDLKKTLDQCYEQYGRKVAAEQDLHSTVLAMKDRGMSKDEVRDAFIKAQKGRRELPSGNVGAESSQRVGTGSDVRVDVRRRDQSTANGHRNRQTQRPVRTGGDKYVTCWHLCALVIPALFIIGLIAEFWAASQGTRTHINVRYIKAALYIGVWFMLLRDTTPKWISLPVTLVLATAACFMAVASETWVTDIAQQLCTGRTWLLILSKTQWYYWGALAVTYVYGIWKLGYGPLYWAQKG